mgnify:FL=1
MSKPKKKGDAAVDVMLWVSVVVMLSSAGVVWYMIARFMRCVEAITERMIGGPIL